MGTINIEYNQADTIKDFWKKAKAAFVKKQKEISVGDWVFDSYWADSGTVEYAWLGDSECLC